MRQIKVAFFLALLVAVFACFVYAQDSAGSFRFAVIADIQQPHRANDYTDVTYRFIREIAATDVDFVIIAGDLVANDADMAETADRAWRQFDALVQPLYALGKEIYAVPGNWDVGRANAARGFDERFGKRYQAFAHKRAAFVLLDSEADRTAVRFRYLGWPQWRWLRTEPWREAARPDPALLFTVIHRPVFRSEFRKLDWLNVTGYDQFDLARFLARYRFAAVFAGHEHLYDHRIVNGVNYYITGGGGGGRLLPTGYREYLLVTADPPNRTFQVEVHRAR